MTTMQPVSSPVSAKDGNVVIVHKRSKNSTY